MSWGESPGDFTGEPRKVFVNFLIFNLKQIEAQIFFGGAATTAIKSLRGLIGSLDKKSQKALTKPYNKLLKFDNNGTCGRKEIEDVYREICAFLHDTYLSEVSRGIIPASTLPSAKPKPTTKKYDRTLSDEVV